MSVNKVDGQRTINGQSTSVACCKDQSYRLNDLPLLVWFLVLLLVTVLCTVHEHNVPRGTGGQARDIRPQGL